MKNKTRKALLLLVSSLPVAASGESWRSHFDADAGARPPAFFDAATLAAPGKANWIVIADFNPPSAPNQLTQTMKSRPDGSIAVALRRNVSLEDGKLSVALKKLPSRAGLVFRMAGERDFLVLLLDGQSGQARLTTYRGGVPTELARGDALLDREWGILTVSLDGATVSARWNEKDLLRGSDPGPASGQVGLATEGTGIAAFDELVIDRKP
ncbi:MAG: hypothetical protein ACRD3M_11900 [Thermoanaerobaculia bacterium]